LPWEGFSHRNSRMSVHPLPVVHGVAGIEDAERLLGQQQTSCMRQRPLSRRWNGLGGMACGRRCASREPRCSGARGSRWTLMELSPGDSSRGHGGRQRTAAAPTPDHFLRLGSFDAAGSWAAWGLGCASCAVSCDLGLRTTDSMRNGRMPTLRALICQVSRG